MKIKDKECVCTYCKSEFLAADVKASVCDKCKEDRKVCPTCGRPKGIKANHCKACSKSHTHKGKTYQEIYGRKVNCGAKKGENNLAKRPDIRKKISEGVKRSYTPELRALRSQKAYEREDFICSFKGRTLKNKSGKLFRSSLEVIFSDFLERNHIEYEYEKRIPMINGKIKVVDFYIKIEGERNIIVEVSGFAYESWKLDMISKLKVLSESTGDYIVIPTYHTHFVSNEYLRMNVNKNIFFIDIEEDLDRFLKTKEFCENLNLLNKLLENDDENKITH